MFQSQSNIKTVKKPWIGTYTMMCQLNHHYWMLVGYQKAVEFINISVCVCVVVGGEDISENVNIKCL